jgi:thiol-disulfide isomerase/thioredoxin
MTMLFAHNVFFKKSKLNLFKPVYGRILNVLIISFVIVMVSFETSSKEQNELVIDYFGSGQSTTLGRLNSGKPVYLKFWASWCVPCLKEMKHLEEAYRQYKDSIEFVAINIGINESTESINSVKKKFNLTVPIAIDKNNSFKKKFQFSGTPYHVLLDRAGKSVYTTHTADALLDSALEMLSIAEKLGRKTGEQNSSNGVSSEEPERIRILYFTATWCHSYFSESRPKMAKSCADTQRKLNEFHKNNKSVLLEGVITHLWTSKEELEEYKKDFEVDFPITLDKVGERFYEYNVSYYPTILVLRDEKEIYRSNEYDLNEINKFL